VPGSPISSASSPAIARPGQPVIGLTGDGSFAMACGELETAARLNLPIIYVQFTNGSFGWIKMLQHLYVGERYFSVEPGPIDVVLVAQGMGIAAERASSLDHFKTIFAAALASGRPTYIDVPVPDQIALTPPVAPWQATLAGKAGRTAY
jgi:acetolactate synthase I/II/III large subunit